MSTMEPLTPLDATTYRQPQRRNTRWSDWVPFVVGGVAGGSIALTGRYGLAAAVTVVWLAGMYAWRATHRSK
jgi:hypothetical protein